MHCAILAVLAVSAQAAFLGGAVKQESKLQVQGSISPDVDKSDKKFFGKDYPWDKRPVADEHYVFNHPYPAVQDSGDFDSDFVKDENSDGGKWKAQMDYDTLRHKIRVAKEKLAELKAKMEGTYEDWQKSKETSSVAGRKAAAAGSDSGKAKAAAEAAAKKVNDLEGGSSADGTKIGGEVGDAIKKVQKEMSDLEKCKKALADAKERLKQLLKDKDEFDKKTVAAKEQRDAAQKKADEEDAAEAKADAEAEAKAKKEGKAVAEKHAKKKAKKVAKEKEEEEEAAFDEAAWKKKLDSEKKDHAQALKSYEQELRDVKLTEDQLARAAVELRKFRRPPHVDANGGVYYEDEKSSAFSMQSNAAMLLAVLVAALSA